LLRLAGSTYSSGSAKGPMRRAAIHCQALTLRPRISAIRPAKYVDATMSAIVITSAVIFRILAGSNPNIPLEIKDGER
jgi:hypothetical protein